ncbi:MAG: shikimate kinase [Deltaproteobacteria bacterium]|nr:MAG: shikimate kinase [Deltaproteobacteria bacterium]
MEKKNNIYLIGFMGAGKTTIGKFLSQKLNYNFVDLDLHIEKEQGISISEMFEKHGEKYFRDAETESLRKFSEKSNQIISTGGGIVIKDENWQIMRNRGVSVYLKSSIKTLFNRVKHKSTRPLLNVENPFEKAKELFSSRESLYEKSDIIIDREGLEPGDVADAIVRELDI